MSWLWAFLFTQAVEIPIYIVGARTRPDEAFCASAMTHPIVWFVIPLLTGWLVGALGPDAQLWMDTPRLGNWSIAYMLMILVAETFAVVAEGFYLRWLGKKSPFVWSLVANMGSVGLGFTSRALFGVP